jgi:hypothetical protein
MLAPNICGSSVWNLLYVTLLVTRIFRQHLGFGKFVHTHMCVRAHIIHIVPLFMPPLSLEFPSAEEHGLYKGISSAY